jgi:hypothetical protein
MANTPSIGLRAMVSAVRAGMKVGFRRVIKMKLDYLCWFGKLWFGTWLIITLIALIALSIDIMEAKGLIDKANWTRPLKEGSLAHLTQTKD